MSRKRVTQVPDEDDILKIDYVEVELRVMAALLQKKVKPLSGTMSDYVYKASLTGRKPKPPRMWKW
jgi:hypothetical protein